MKTDKARRLPVLRPVLTFEQLESRIAMAKLTPTSWPTFEKSTRGGWNQPWSPATVISPQIYGMSTVPWGTLTQVKPVYELQSVWTATITVEPTRPEEKLGDPVKVDAAFKTTTSSGSVNWVPEVPLFPYSSKTFHTYAKIFGEVLYDETLDGAYPSTTFEGKASKLLRIGDSFDVSWIMTGAAAIHPNWLGAQEGASVFGTTALTGDIGATISVDDASDYDLSWIVHGFNPYFFSAQQSSQFDSDWESYRNPVKMALESDGSDAKVELLKWDSSSGWNKAIGFQVVKGVLQTLAAVEKPLRPFVAFAMPFLDRVILEGIREGNFNSLKASNQLQAHIAKEVAELPSGVDYSVTLIGHSRGGEIAARALSNLRPMLDQKSIPSQLVLLDGYGRDWPGVSRILGTNTPAGRLEDWNLRVQYDLLEYLTGEIIGGILRDAFSYLASKSLPSVTLPIDMQFLDTAPWKAPNRPSMQNRVLAETSHVTIAKKFFRGEFEGDDAALKQFLRASRFESGSGEWHIRQDPQEVGPIRGGDGAELSGLYRRILADAEIISQAPDFVKPLFDAWADPSAWVRTFWQTVGDVSLLPEPDLISMSGLESSITQAVLVPREGGTLLIRLASPLESVVSEGIVQVSLEGDVVATLPFSSSQADSELRIPIGVPVSGQEAVDLTVSFLGADEASVLTFKEIRWEATAPEVSGEVVLMGGVPGLRVGVSNLGDASDVQVFAETNGIEGLQSSDGGDELILVTSTTGEWAVSPPSQMKILNSLYAKWSGTGEVEMYTQVAVTNAFQTNIAESMDVDQDGTIAPIDALLVINVINERGNGVLVTSFDYLIDVNLDGVASPADALLVITRLNGGTRNSVREGEADVIAVEDADIARRAQRYAEIEMEEGWNTDDVGIHHDVAVQAYLQEVHSPTLGMEGFGTHLKGRRRVRWCRF